MDFLAKSKSSSTQWITSVSPAQTCEPGLRRSCTSTFPEAIACGAPASPVQEI